VQTDVLLRYGALFFLVLQEVYWAFAEHQSDLAKPKLQAASRRANVERLALTAFVVFMALQLLDIVNLAEFPPNPPIQAAGLVLILVATAILISARRTLGANWSHAVEYQIKPGQELVTTGIYRYVQHPIYAGLSLGIIGIELAAHSLFVWPLIPALAWISYIQARREEALLRRQFGDTYRRYASRTARFIPGLW
jgi:protein-S-isoprenylcysteine O-methyltransferase Ste14